MTNYCLYGMKQKKRHIIDHTPVSSTFGLIKRGRKE